MASQIIGRPPAEAPLPMGSNKDENTADRRGVGVHWEPVNMKLWWKQMGARTLIWFGLPVLLGGGIFSLDPANNAKFFFWFVGICLLTGLGLQAVVAVGIYRRRDRVYRQMKVNDVYRLCSAIVYQLEKAKISIRFDHPDHTHFYAALANHRIVIEARKRGSAHWSISVTGRLEPTVDQVLHAIDDAVVRGHT